MYLFDVEKVITIIPYLEFRLFSSETIMIIVNGRVLGDLLGAITVHHKQECSTVGHAIISHELLH